MGRVWRATAMVAFGFVCVALGARIEADSHTPAPTPAPPPKILVEKKTVQVPTIPESCKRVLEMAPTLRDAAGQYDTTTGTQVDIMDSAIKALFEKDAKALNDLITRQRAVRDATVPASDTLHRELEGFDRLLGTCRTDLGG